MPLARRLHPPNESDTVTLEEFVAEHPADRDRVEAYKAEMTRVLDRYTEEERAALERGDVIITSPKRKRKQRRAHKGYTNSRRTRANRGRGNR